MRSFAALPGGTVTALSLVAASTLALSTSSASAQSDDLGVKPAALPAAKSEIPDDRLTGRDIYQRVLDNSFTSLIQESSLRSADRGGNEQESRFTIWYEDLRRDGNEDEPGAIISRTLVKYSHPFDIRYSGYLILSNHDAMNDQFVYLPSQRRVKRVSLRGEPVFGTDFSFEDILPKEIEDADYQRLADEELDGAPVFAIEAVPRSHADSEYSRIRIYVEKERSVVLRNRYWDDRGVEIKQLSVARESIDLIEGVWVPRQMTMRHLKLESYTTLERIDLTPNPKLSRSTFELRRLESH